MSNVLHFRGLPLGRLILGALFLLIPASAQDRRIAIYDFDSRTADLSLRGKVPAGTNLGHQAADKVMTILVNSPTHFEVIERAAIERILKEQGKKYDERFDPASAPELGRLLNVDGIVLGEVTSASAAIQASNFKIPFGSKGPVIGGKSAKAKVGISVRLISTQTGSIQLAQSAEGDASVSVSSSVSGVGAGSNSDDITALAQSVTAAIDKGVSRVSSAVIAKAATLPKIQHPGAPLNSSNPTPGGAPIAPAGDRVPTVLSVDGAKVYIDGGQDLKLMAGDRYDVRQVTKVLDAPGGRKIPITERIETIIIEDVQPNASVARVEGAGASNSKPGAILQKSTSLPPLLQGPPPAAIPGPPPAPAKKGPVPVKKFQ